MSYLKILMRALSNRNISTGNTSTTENQNYASKRPSNVYNITNEPIVDEGAQCYILHPAQCTSEQWKSVMNDTALVRNWIVVDANTSHLFPDLNTSGNGTTPSDTGSPMPAYTGSASRGLPAVGSVIFAAVAGGLAML
jgi:hypothetical protein